MNEPTNADIFRLLGKFEQRFDDVDTHFKVVESRLDGIHTQTQKTNGRVNRLEARNELADEKIKWEKENDTPVPVITTPTTTSEGKPVDFTKIILGLIGLSTGLVALAQFLASQSK